MVARGEGLTDLSYLMKKFFSILFSKMNYFFQKNIKIQNLPMGKKNM